MDNAKQNQKAPLPLTSLMSRQLMEALSLELHAASLPWAYPVVGISSPLRTLRALERRGLLSPNKDRTAYVLTAAGWAAVASEAREMAEHQIRFARECILGMKTTLCETREAAWQKRMIVGAQEILAKLPAYSSRRAH